MDEYHFISGIMIIKSVFGMVEAARIFVVVII